MILVAVFGRQTHGLQVRVDHNDSVALLRADIEGCCTVEVVVADGFFANYGKPRCQANGVNAEWQPFVVITIAAKVAFDVFVLIVQAQRRLLYSNEVAILRADKANDSVVALFVGLPTPE